MDPDLGKISALAVHLNDRRIGTISRLAGDRHFFAFEEDYVEDQSRPTLSLSFKGRAGGLVTNPRTFGRRLPPFFSNLLPEGHLRTYLADKAGVKPEREFYLLALLGIDVAGAVIVRPIESRAGDGDGRRRDVQRDHRERDPDVLRFSLAGVQLKFSAVAEASGGLTIPARGVGGSWIVKLPSLRFPAVPENEFAMLELARAVGIQVPVTRLVPLEAIRGLPPDAAHGEGNALAVERFDRATGGRRIHMEDFAQVFGVFPDDKYAGRSYANIASVLWAETGETDTREFVRRLAFSVIIGNADMHLKNWSLLYPDGRTPVLSPAYDFVSTVPYLPGDTLALGFGGSRALNVITLDQVRRLAETAGLPMHPTWETVRETVDRTAEAWKTLPQKERLPTPIRNHIDRQIHGVVSSTRKQG